MSNDQEGKFVGRKGKFVRTVHYEIEETEFGGYTCNGESIRDLTQFTPRDDAAAALLNDHLKARGFVKEPAEPTEPTPGELILTGYDAFAVARCGWYELAERGGLMPGVKFMLATQAPIYVRKVGGKDYFERGPVTTSVYVTGLPPKTANPEPLISPRDAEGAHVPHEG